MIRKMTIPSALLSLLVFLSACEEPLSQVDATTCTVSYHWNGATSGTLPEDTKYYEKGETVTVADNTGNLEKTGYQFSGWNTRANGNGTDYQAGSTFTMGEEDITLYAEWSEFSYVVTFDSQGADTESSPSTIVVASPATTISSLPTAPERVPYNFAGWFTEPNGGGTQFTAQSVVSDNITVYAYWTTEATYTVDFSTDDGSTLFYSCSAVEGALLSPPDPGPSRPGYTFDGWFTDSSGMNEWNFSSDTVHSNLTLYAEWSPRIYTITFDKNADDATGTMEQQSITFGASASLYENAFSREGYTFAGWSYSTRGSVLYADRADFTMGTGDEILYARWNRNDAASTSSFTYSITGEELVITAYTGSDTIVVIPDIIETRPVTSIGKSAFAEYRSLSSVSIPDSVTTIGESAFEYCDSLTSVLIPDSVSSIGSSAFRYCTGLEVVTLPDSVSSIGSYAFVSCSNLREVNIPSSVTSIESYTFYGCSSLTSVSIPSSVTTIGNSAFAGCSGVASVTIPDSVSIIEENAFADCSNLGAIVIPPSVTTIGESTFEYCSSLASVSIPDSVTSIGALAFTSCTSLLSVTIPASVSSIGNYAFYYCSSLDTVNVECSSPPVIGTAVFDANAETRIIFVPESADNSVITAYTSAESWTGYEAAIQESTVSGG